MRSLCFAAQSMNCTGVSIAAVQDYADRIDALLAGLPGVGEGLTCMDCETAYSAFPLDTTLPDEQWRLIHDSEGGVLCASCIVRRAARLPGIVAVRARLEFAKVEAGGSLPNTRIRQAGAPSDVPAPCSLPASSLSARSAPPAEGEERNERVDKTTARQDVKQESPSAGRAQAKCDIAACNCGSWHQHRPTSPPAIPEALRGYLEAMRAEADRLCPIVKQQPPEGWSQVDTNLRIVGCVLAGWADKFDAALRRAQEGEKP